MPVFCGVRAQVNQLGRGLQVLNMVFQIDELASAESVQLRDAVVVCHNVQHSVLLVISNNLARISISLVLNLFDIPRIRIRCIFCVNYLKPAVLQIHSQTEHPFLLFVPVHFGNLLLELEVLHPLLLNDIEERNYVAMSQEEGGVYQAVRGVKVETINCQFKEQVFPVRVRAKNEGFCAF